MGIGGFDGIKLAIGEMLWSLSYGITEHSKNWKQKQIQLLANSVAAQI